jgi:threonine/homoserine/homoserine lactone efflux protein
MIRFDFAGYLIFAVVTLITPGPNNYMLFAHGRNFGFSDARKLMAGIFTGFIVLLLISGYGISEIILKNPTVGLVLKIISSIWLLYLAFVLSKINIQLSNNSNAKIGFYQAFLMQFVNPKAWIVAISGASVFLPNLGNVNVNVLVFAFTFALVGVPCMIIWVKFGNLISIWLKSEKVNNILSLTIFTLMLSCIVLVWL